MAERHAEQNRKRVRHPWTEEARKRQSEIMLKIWEKRDAEREAAEAQHATTGETDD